MDKLQWLEIQNFRGIKHVKIEDFTDLVFIGKNNTGKSTILEGIYLNLLLKGQKQPTMACVFFHDFFNKNPFEVLRNKRKRAFDDHWAYKKNFPIRILSNLSELTIPRPFSWGLSGVKNVVLLYLELCIDPSYPLYVREHIADFGLEAIQKIAKALTERLGLEEELGYIEETDSVNSKAGGIS